MKTITSLTRSSAWALTAALLVPSVTPAQVSNPIPYTLNPGSTYQTGCFAPCDCPLSREFELTGTFTLTCMFTDPSAIGGHGKYIIQNAEWLVQLPDSSLPPVPVVGVGSYEWLGIAATVVERARLELEIDAAARMRFDSWWDDALPLPFPDIRVVVPRTDSPCQSTVIALDASPLGACCPGGPDDSACLIATEAECTKQGGAYQGNGSTCPTEPGVLCGVAEGVDFACTTGLLWHACCFPSPEPSEPACLILTEQECTSAGGTFLPGAECDPVVCDATPVACCDPSLPCRDTLMDNCIGNTVIPLGPGSSCATTDCSTVVSGACCAADQDFRRPCFPATPEACAFTGGTYHGDGTTCPLDAQELCGPFTGACCRLSANGTGATCDVITFDACLAAGGIYQGDHTTCAPGECNCCFQGQSCTTMPNGVCVTLGGAKWIPAVSAWGVLILALLLGAVGTAVIVRAGGAAATD